MSLLWSGLWPRSSAPSGGSYKVRGDRRHPSSQGMVCVKGATILEALDRDRLVYPLWRERLDQPFRMISWDEALTRLVERLQRVRQEQGADAICMYGSGQFLTEDYYVAQKLIKGCLGTNNFDANSRLCMSSAVSAYMGSFGSDGPPAATTTWRRPTVPFSLAPIRLSVILLSSTGCGITINVTPTLNSLWWTLVVLPRLRWPTFTWLFVLARTLTYSTALATCFGAGGYP